MKALKDHIVQVHSVTHSDYLKATKSEILMSRVAVHPCKLCGDMVVQTGWALARHMINKHFLDVEDYYEYCVVSNRLEIAVRKVCSREKRLYIFFCGTVFFNLY